MGKRDQTSGAMIARASTTAQALELRMAGFSYPEIAAKLGIAVGTAHKYVAGSIAKTRQEAAETAEEIRTLEVSRLDKMLAVLAPMAESGDMQAIDRILKIQERRAAYLGLDAPKAQLVAVDSRPDTVKALMALVSNSKLDAGQAATETVIDVTPEGEP